MTRSLCLLLTACWVVAEAQAQYPAEAANNWHQWRGPLATGEAPNATPPTKWSESENVVWKTAIPGRGSSSPIVWGDKIFVTSAIEIVDPNAPAPEVQAEPQGPPPGGPGGPDGRRGRGGRGFGRGGPPTNTYEFVVLCIDAKSGDVVWQKTAHKQVPHEGKHGTNTYASPSPITDGKHVYASFGSFGIYCFDMDGNQVWNKDLGDMQTRNSFGEGTSPALWGDTLIVNWDHEGPSFIAALDAQTGDEIWRQDRDEATSWNTPLVVEAAGKTQVIVNGSNRSRSYDLKTGELIWECGGQATSPISCPMAYEGLVFCMTGFRGEALYAISLDSKGDVTDTESVAWSRNRNTPYVPSGMLMSGRLYFTKSTNNILTSLDAKTGEPLIESERLPDVDSIYASPVGAAGHIYVTDRDGTTVVVKDAPEFEVVSTNQLDEPVDASPALVGDRIYIRGESSLYCIGE